MDLAMAIWQIDPAMEYVLSHDHTAIWIWRGPGPRPTEEGLRAAWAAYRDPATRRAEPHAP